MDSSRVYAFGWSYGGGIAALLSLLDDVPIRHSASSGGLFDAAHLRLLSGYIEMPFDVNDSAELELRLLVGNIRWMQRPHYAYIGSADDTFVSAVVAAKREMEGRETLLRINMTPGEHFSAAAPAALRYRDRIRQEHQQVQGVRPQP